MGDSLGHLAAFLHLHCLYNGPAQNEALSVKKDHFTSHRIGSWDPGIMRGFSNGKMRRILERHFKV